MHRHPTREKPEVHKHPNSPITTYIKCLGRAAKFRSDDCTVPQLIDCLVKYHFPKMVEYMAAFRPLAADDIYRHIEQQINTKVSTQRKFEDPSGLGLSKNRRLCLELAYEHLNCWEKWSLGRVEYELCKRLGTKSSQWQGGWVQVVGDPVRPLVTKVGFARLAEKRLIEYRGSAESVVEWCHRIWFSQEYQARAVESLFHSECKRWRIDIGQCKEVYSLTRSQAHNIVVGICSRNSYKGVVEHRSETDS